MNELSEIPAHNKKLKAAEKQHKQLEDELRNDRERLNFLLTSVPVVVYAARTSGDFGATFVAMEAVRLCWDINQRILHQSLAFGQRIFIQTTESSVSGDTLVFGDASGAVRALRIADGSIAWEYKTDDPVYSTPAVAGGRVVFCGTDGAVRALDARLGTLDWQVQTGGPVVASPSISDGVVYIGSGDHIFRAISLASGDPVWSYSGIEGFVETKPLVAGGLVVFGAWDGRLYALDAKTGRLAWTWQGEQPSPYYAPAACWPVAAAGKVFIVAPDRMMTAIELASGREVWGTDNITVRESIGLSEDGKRVYVRAVENIIAAVRMPKPTARRPSGRPTPVSARTSARPSSWRRMASSSTGRRTACSWPSTERPAPSSGSTGSASPSSTR